MYGYIYKTTNLINQKIYIGQHKSEKFDESYKGSGKLLKSAIKKYGWDNFKCEIIVWADSRCELNALEIYYIQEYRDENYVLYNIAKGGEGGSGPCSPETKAKLSQRNMGHPVSDYVRQRVSEASTGRIPHNKGIPEPEWKKERQSITMSGRKAIIKDGKIKRPSLDKLNDYLDNGWKLVKEK